MVDLLYNVPPRESPDVAFRAFFLPTTFMTANNNPTIIKRNDQYERSGRKEPVSKIRAWRWDDPKTWVRRDQERHHK